MSISINTAFANELLKPFNTVFSEGVLKLYSAPVADNADVATATGDELVTINLPATPFTAPSGAAISRNGAWSGFADAAGTAAYYRITGNVALGFGSHVKQGTVSVAGAGGDLELDNVVMSVGSFVNVVSANITQPKS